MDADRRITSRVTSSVNRLSFLDRLGFTLGATSPVSGGVSRSRPFSRSLASTTKSTTTRDKFGVGEGVSSFGLKWVLPQTVRRRLEEEGDDRAELQDDSHSSVLRRLIFITLFVLWLMLGLTLTLTVIALMSNNWLRSTNSISMSNPQANILTLFIIVILLLWNLYYGLRGVRKMKIEKI